MADGKWNDDLIQFSRLISEIEANGGFTSQLLNDLAKEMDLDIDEISQLIDRAQHRWAAASTLNRSPRWVIYDVDLDEVGEDVYTSLGEAMFDLDRFIDAGLNVRLVDMGFMAEPDVCVRCQSPLVNERCSDLTCPFHDVSQDDERGWIGHPTRPDIQEKADTDV